MLSKIESEVDRSSSKLFIRAYHREYDDPYLPPSWAMSECVSLGMWSRTYKMLRDPRSVTSARCGTLLPSFTHGMGLPYATTLAIRDLVRQYWIQDSMTAREAMRRLATAASKTAPPAPDAAKSGTGGR
jgi:hypothetical protein